MNFTIFRLSSDLQNTHFPVLALNIAITGKCERKNNTWKMEAYIGTDIMEKESVEKYLASFKGSEGSYPFGPEALVYKVMGKMFALVSQHEEIPRVTFKCIPEDGALLVGQYESVIPGYHMNKKHWITISLTGELPEEMLIDLANNSYNLVVSKLTKKDKENLNNI